MHGIVDFAIDPLVFLRIITKMEDERNLVAGGVSLGGIGVFDVAFGRTVLESRSLHPDNATTVRARVVLVYLDLAVLVGGVVRNVINP